MATPATDDEADGLLTRRQEMVVLALLESRTVAAAAKKLNVSERQLYRHLADPKFAAAYARGRKEAFSNAMSAISPLATEAVATLRAALKSRDVSARIRAAKVILDKAFTGIAISDLAGEVAGIKAEQAAAEAARPAPPPPSPPTMPAAAEPEPATAEPATQPQPLFDEESP